MYALANGPNGIPFFLAVAIATLIAGAIGWWLMTLIRPKHIVQAPSDIGRKWCAYIVFLVCVTNLTPVIGKLNVNSFALWLLAMSVFGVAAYVLGWCYGKFFVYKKTGNVRKAFGSNIDSGNVYAASNDDELFTQVAKEMVRKEIDEGLWAKAFALQDGDEKKTKAHYIRLRVEQLSCHDIALKSNGLSENGTSHETVQADRRNPLKWVAAVAGVVVVVGILAAVMTSSKQPSTQLLSDAEVGLTAANSTQPKQENPSREPFDPFAPDNLNPYEKRAWSGNLFDQFNTVDWIKQKALAHDSRLSDRRAWDAVLAWQSANMRYWNWKANSALYAAVDEVLEGFKRNHGVCRPGKQGLCTRTS